MKDCSKFLDKRKFLRNLKHEIISLSINIFLEIFGLGNIFRVETCDRVNYKGLAPFPADFGFFAKSSR